MEGGKEQSTSREVQEVDMAEGGSGRRWEVWQEIKVETP